jgi:hypothetical protein
MGEEIQSFEIRGLCTGVLMTVNTSSANGQLEKKQWKSIGYGEK